MPKIFWLEFTSLVRSWTLPLLVISSVGWTLLAPHFVRGDGTAVGDHTTVLSYALFGVVALVFIALASAAAGSLSSERSAKRLQLTLLKPIPFFAIAFGRVLALTAAGSLAFALSLATLHFTSPDSERCRHVLHPVMETPREEAERMYEVYMNDPETPEEVKRAKRSSVLAILTQKALDHYLPVPTNAVTSWDFLLPEVPADCPLWARIRFSDTFSRKQDVRGLFILGDSTAVVSNISQSVNLYPLIHSAAIPASLATLSFENRGTSSLMLRPRRDVELLIAADSRLANFCRGWLELSALLMVVVALGVFLGAALSRPVAVWTVLVMLVLSIASPAVIDQYPMELEIPRDDAIALVLSRAMDIVTRPLNSFSPIARLSENECLEWSEVISALALDAFFLPLVFTLLSAWVIRQKKLD